MEMTPVHYGLFRMRGILFVTSSPISFIPRKKAGKIAENLFWRKEYHESARNEKRAQAWGREQRVSFGGRLWQHDGSKPQKQEDLDFYSQVTAEAVVPKKVKGGRSKW